MLAALGSPRAEQGADEQQLAGTQRKRRRHSGHNADAEAGDGADMAPPSSKRQRGTEGGASIRLLFSSRNQVPCHPRSFRVEATCQHQQYTAP